MSVSLLVSRKTVFWHCQRSLRVKILPEKILQCQLFIPELWCRALKLLPGWGHCGWILSWFTSFPLFSGGTPLTFHLSCDPASTRSSHFPRIWQSSFILSFHLAKFKAILWPCLNLKEDKRPGLCLYPLPYVPLIPKPTPRPGSEDLQIPIGQRGREIQGRNSGWVQKKSDFSLFSVSICIFCDTTLG